MKKIISKHIDKLKFASVGVANTVIDIAVLNLLVLIVGLPAIVANTISTGLGITFSFFMNKKWTFESNGKNYLREVVLFFVFSIIAMWVINNGILQVLVLILPSEWAEFLRVNVAKIIASVASMTWNYITYKYVVFRK
jgi:putative flippase GtrA